MNKIKCLICNKEFVQITSTHLKKHDLTVTEYKEKFPNCEIMLQETKDKLSEKCKLQNLKSNFGFKDNHLTNKDKLPWNKGLNKENDLRVKKYSLSLKGRKFSFEHRYKISKSIKKAFKEGRMNVNGENNGMYGKKLSEHHLKRLLESQNYQTINKVEEKAFKTLIQYGFIYTGNRSFWLKFKNGKNKNPDFVNKKCKIAVEIYGDYWHRKDNPQELIDEYKKIGWECYVIWEHEVHNKLSPEYFEKLLNTFELEEFTYVNFNGKWII